MAVMGYLFYNERDEMLPIPLFFFDDYQSPDKRA